MKSRLRLLMGGVALVLSVAYVVAEVERPIFVDKEGQALPIQEEEELLRFLRTATVTGFKKLDEGVTKAKRLDLAQNEMRARAIFHDITRNDPKKKRLPNGRIRAYLRDHYTSQIAAYELGRMLQIHNIPPTTRRNFEGLDGSAQLWIESAITELERQEQGIEPPDQTLWNQLYADMRVFDNLINNIDRNQGNMLVDSQGHLWLIDHTRSFGRDKTIPHPEVITRCSNRLYNAIVEMDENRVRNRLKDEKLLAPGEITAIFLRRSELLEKIDERIRRLGREQVLFDYGDPEPGIKVDEDAG